jgi:hypothetical protein
LLFAGRLSGDGPRLMANLLLVVLMFLSLLPDFTYARAGVNHELLIMAAENRGVLLEKLKAESTNDWRIVAPAGSVPPLSDRFVKWAHRALARGLPEEDESLRLEWALTLGDKAVLTDDVSEPFIRAATYFHFLFSALHKPLYFRHFCRFYPSDRRRVWRVFGHVAHTSKGRIARPGAPGAARRVDL